MRGAEINTWEEAAAKREGSGTVYSRKVGQTTPKDAQEMLKSQ